MAVFCVARALDHMGTLGSGSKFSDLLKTDPSLIFVIFKVLYLACLAF